MHPLHLAIQYGRVEFVRGIKEGANADVLSGTGRTPLWYALKELYRAGIFDRNVNLVNSYAVDVSISPAMIEMAKLLRNAGADPLGHILLHPHDERLKGHDFPPKGKKHKTNPPRRNPPRKSRRLA